MKTLMRRSDYIICVLQNGRSNLLADYGPWSPRNSPLGRAAASPTGCAAHPHDSHWAYISTTPCTAAPPPGLLAHSQNWPPRDSLSPTPCPLRRLSHSSPHLSPILISM
uniref:Uncharacterized protein n=1 Tax=Fagus sylvatica TaxID=28930 RepID=A0A2N9EG38_FAGSY